MRIVTDVVTNQRVEKVMSVDATAAMRCCVSNNTYSGDVMCNLSPGRP